MTPPTPTNTPPTLAVATKSASTGFGNLLLAETIAIQDDEWGWMGEGAIESKAHYTLKRSESSYVGTGNFSERFSSFQGDHAEKSRMATWDIDIPLNVAKNFLQMLMNTPLQTGEHEAGAVMDASFSTTIEIVTPSQTVIFFSTSQWGWTRRWQVTIQTGDTTVKYISSSTIPADALEALKPFLKRGSGLPG